MALVYLVNKPQVSRRITKWLLLFLKYDFTIVYKLGKIHVVVDALSRLSDITKPTCVPNQTTNASLECVEGKAYIENIPQMQVWNVQKGRCILRIYSLHRR
jgi:hypothetical protein